MFRIFVFNRQRPFNRIHFIIGVVYILFLALYAHHLLSGTQYDRVAFVVPSLSITIYSTAVCIALGILLGIRAIAQLVEPQSREMIWAMLPVCLLCGLIGARLYHLFTPPPSMTAVGIESIADYWRNPYQLLNFRNGGLGIWGGIAGGAIGLYIFTHRNQLSFWQWSDSVVVGLALGQSIGRWGDFFSQAQYGRFTTLPWAITIAPQFRLPDVAQYDTFHPAFLYESLWTLTTFYLLWWLAKQSAMSLKQGEATAVYLIAYASGRLLIETVRLNSATLPNSAFPTASAVAVAVLLLSTAVLLWRRLKT